MTKIIHNLLQHLRNKIKISKTNQLTIDTTSKLVDCNISVYGLNNKVLIGKNTTIRNSTIEIHGQNCKISIGDDCVIGDNCYFVAKENEIKIIIDNHCMLSRNVKIMASDGHTIFNKKNDRINHSKSITVSHNVWLADNVTILKGVIVGSNSVVGINSTLTKSIPKNSIAVGNPAKITTDDIYWEK